MPELLQRKKPFGLSLFGVGSGTTIDYVEFSTEQMMGRVLWRNSKY
jgi:hypothetical protein